MINLTLKMRQEWQKVRTACTGPFFLHNLVRGGEIFKLDRGPLFLLNEMAFRDFQSRLNFHCELTACMQRSILY